tara:strand:+ start:380 stop:619 length:240 start_codon:yes stop_codon:yes gene_type:complete
MNPNISLALARSVPYNTLYWSLVLALMFSEENMNFTNPFLVEEGKIPLQVKLISMSIGVLSVLAFNLSISATFENLLFI